MTVPAAVINNGKNLGESSAATRAARYPAHNACEVSASMDCAREIRGTNSSENAVTPAFLAAEIESSEAVGERKEIVSAPFFNLASTAGSNAFTERTTSALARSTAEETVAPAFRKSSSVACDCAPAPLSTSTDTPARINFPTTSGTVATRASPARFSAGITTFNWGELTGEGYLQIRGGCPLQNRFITAYLAVC